MFDAKASKEAPFSKILTNSFCFLGTTKFRGQEGKYLNESLKNLKLVSKTKGSFFLTLNLKTNF